MDKFNPKIYRFERYEMLTGKSLGFLSYKDLVALATDEYFNRRDFVNSIDAYIEEALSKPVLDITKAKEQAELDRLEHLEKNDFPENIEDLGYDTVDYFKDASWDYSGEESMCWSPKVNS